MLLTVHKLFEQTLFWQNLLKFYDKMNLSIQMGIIYKVRHRYAIPLKFGGKFLTFLTKLVLKGKVSIRCTIKENLLFCCRCHNLTYFYN